MRGAILVLGLLWAGRSAAAEVKVILVATTAQAASGEAIEVMGSGTFETARRTIRLGGQFTLLSSSGSPQRRGTWVAILLTRFSRFGHEARVVGGVLEAVGMLVHDDGKIERLPMRFVCLVNHPEDSDEREGVTVGEYARPASGVVRFEMK
jgi:hypothetical protein